MKKRLYILITALLFVFIAGTFGYALANREASNSSNNPNTSVSSSPVSQQAKIPDVKPGKKVTITGKIGCLEHKDKDGPQTMECAYGLKEDSGTAYALRLDDPTLMGNLPWNEPVQVTGTLQPLQNTIYDAAGTIVVESIQQ